MSRLTHWITLLVVVATVLMAAVMMINVAVKAQSSIPTIPTVPVLDQAHRNNLTAHICGPNVECIGKGYLYPHYLDFTVPATTASGQPVLRFVIEFVSLHCSVTLGSSYAAFPAAITNRPGGSATPLVGQDMFMHFFPVGVSASTQETRIYAAPGSVVGLARNLGGNTETPNIEDNSSRCEGFLTGYLAVAQ
ncbi:MAG: hypothetical protein DMG30_29930 [Acidobacteria bacterium]|nr:MAG: hypothetical protein DMG30_29930 [Acidobacteriota bacterium]